MPSRPSSDFFASEASDAIWMEPSLFRAMVTCLSPVDKCAMLRTDMQQNYLNRRVLLSLIGEDMQSHFAPEHAKLIDELIQSMSDLPGNQAQSCGYCLEYLTESAPEAFKDRVINTMMASRFKSVRDRGARLIRKRWKPDYLPLLRELAPERLGESMQAVYVEHEDVECLLATRHELCPCLADKNISRLYRRLVGREPGVLVELRHSAPVSYIYIAAKEGVAIEPEVAFEISREAHGSAKFGLVVWSIGRLKLWDVLVAICSSLPEWEEERRARVVKKYGHLVPEASEGPIGE